MPDRHDPEPTLRGKQLVFVFMAATVAAVVVFLSGVMVGRGVRLQRGGLAFGDSVGDPTLDAAPPLAATAGTTAEGPSPASREGLSYPSQLSDLKPPDVLPEPAEDPTAEVLGRVPAAEAPKTTVDSAKGQAPGRTAPTQAVTKKPTMTKPAAEVARARASADSKAPVAAGPESASGPKVPALVAADADAGRGFAVQVAAVRDRTEADRIAGRLKARGYATYITSPAPGMFRVRVGRFEALRDAEAAAARLEKEEQFKPWITK